MHKLPVLYNYLFFSFFIHNMQFTATVNVFVYLNLFIVVKHFLDFIYYAHDHSTLHQHSGCVIMMYNIQIRFCR